MGVATAEAQSGGNGSTDVRAVLNSFNEEAGKLNFWLRTE